MVPLIVGNSHILILFKGFFGPTQTVGAHGVATCQDFALQRYTVEIEKEEKKKETVLGLR